MDLRRFGRVAACIAAAATMSAGVAFSITIVALTLAVLVFARVGRISGDTYRLFILTDAAREAFMKTFGRPARDMGMHVVYDISHNLAKIETYEIEGASRRLCVHRKGATPAAVGIMGALKQVGFSGTAEQRQKALEVLNDTKRKLYAILAESVMPTVVTDYIKTVSTGLRNLPVKIPFLP